MWLKTNGGAEGGRDEVMAVTSRHSRIIDTRAINPMLFLFLFVTAGISYCEGC